MTMLTALEMFTNPYDLTISIGREKMESGRYALAICRGPGHNFKPMINSQPFTEKLDEVIQEIKKILDTVVQLMTKEFEDKRSIPSQYLNPDGQTLDPSKVLSAELIAQIIEKLETKQIAHTSEMRVKA